MSEMPETLRNLGYHLRVMADKASEQIDADRLSRAADEVERADLPPTLSAAMELPEVKALKDERDAATAAYWLVRSYAVHDDDCTINRYPNRNACSCGLRNALAAIKEPKT